MHYIKKLISSIYDMKFTTALFIGTIMIVYVLSHASRSIEYFYLLKNSSNPGLEFTFERFRFLLHSSVKHDMIKLLSPEVPEQSSMPSFHIYVDTKDIARLDANLPQSGRNQYVTAYLKTDDSKNRRRISMRYRGDSHYHWLYPKKSLRIKLEKGDLYNMERKFNLINLTSLFMTNEILNYEMAKEAGLMSPDFYPVRVFINDNYSGVYMYLSQVDESVLRKHKRMPGSIYYGEKPLLDMDYESLLWKDEAQWAKRASRSLEKRNDRSDIAYFIDAINNFTDTEFYAFANNYLDKEKFYSFFSLDTYFGGYHHDYFHNHKIYFDPYNGKFEPFAWDLRFWTNIHAKDTSFYSLLEKIKLNPVLEYERDLHAYKLLIENDTETAARRFREHNDLLHNDLAADTNRDTAEYTAPFNGGAALPFTMHQFTQTIQYMQDTLTSRHEYLNKMYNEVDAIFNTRKLNNGSLLVTFKVTGNNPVNVDLLNSFSDNAAVSVYRSSHYKSGSNPSLNKTINKKISGPQILYPGRMYVNGNATGHSGYSLFGSRMLVGSPLYYSYVIKGDFKPGIDKIMVSNAITGKQTFIHRKQHGFAPWSDSIHPWDIPAPEHKHLTLSGNINIYKTVEYDNNTTVTIQPGTVFKMKAGASMVFKGRVNARGSANRPIIFKAADAAPWGSIVVQGKNTSNSRFEHIHISGGSVTTHDLINYPGQFNIHDSENFLVSSCRISNNHTGDDNMHVAYSTGTIDNCIFTNSLSDALDVDISTVEIKNSLFLDSGNDALDFMTSQALVHNNLFIRSGDKCISTGEWSKGTFRDNVMTQCHIGVEIKDMSDVTLSHSIIYDSKLTDINLYNKNYRYNSGGKLRARDMFLPDKLAIRGDERSSHELLDVKYIFPPIDEFASIKKKFPHIGAWQDIGTAGMKNRNSKP